MGKLYPISATGIRAYCSDLVIDPDDYETVFFMSICGYQATVKGVIANLLENYGISVEIDGRQHYLARSSLGYKVMIKKLPSGLVHSVVFPKLAFPKNDEKQQNDFFIFTRNRKEVLSLFYRHLDEKTDIPLHPSWDNWLWQKFERQDWVTELTTLAGVFKGFCFSFCPNKLHDLISEAIRKKEPEIIDCFQWKGEEEQLWET